MKKARGFLSAGAGKNLKLGATLVDGRSSDLAGEVRRAAFAPAGPLAIDPRAYGVEVEISGEVVEAPAFVEVAGVAVVRVEGPLAARACMFWDGYDAIASRIGLALESGCSGVVVVFDSPGGMVTGCFDAAGALRARARAVGKPLIAFVEGAALSAAYALASQCDRIIAASSAYVGSVGVVEGMMDTVEADRAAGLRFALVTSGARKADGSPHVPISKEALASTQGRVDALALLFCGLVEAGRGVPAASVAALECEVFVGADAVRLGLADAVGTMADALAAAAGGSAGMQAAKGPEVVMDEDEKKAVEALRALVKAGGKAAKGAKAALAAMGAAAEGEEEETPKDDGGDVAAEGEEEEVAAESEEEEPAAEGEEEETPKARRAASASKGASASTALAAKLVELDRRVRAQETSAERTRLLASRPDLMAQAEIKTWLSAAPIEEVRRAVKAIPRAPRANPAAAQSAQATRGEGQVDKGAPGARSDRSPAEVREKLDAKMGFAPKAPRIERQGNAVFFRPLTADEARSLGKDGSR